MGTLIRGVVGIGKLAGKGIWLVGKLLVVVLSLGIVAWVRHRRNKKLRDRQSAVESREHALEQRLSAMETKDPDAAAPDAAAPAAPPEAPPVT